MHLDVRGQATLHDVKTGAISHMISIGDGDRELCDFRLPCVQAHRQLCLHFRDRKSADRDGAPTETQIRPLFEWLDSAGEIDGLLVHCGAGMSRSPAIAVLALCHLQPSKNPYEQMVFVENCSTCNYIWPNPLVVELGDRIMRRNGKIVDGVNCWRRMKEPATAE